MGIFVMLELYIILSEVRFICVLILVVYGLKYDEF